MLNVINEEKKCLYHSEHARRQKSYKSIRILTSSSGKFLSIRAQCSRFKWENYYLCSSFEDFQKHFEVSVKENPLKLMIYPIYSGEISHLSSKSSGFSLLGQNEDNGNCLDRDLVTTQLWWLLTPRTQRENLFSGLIKVILLFLGVFVHFGSKQLTKAKKCNRK